MPALKSYGGLVCEQIMGSLDVHSSFPPPCLSLHLSSPFKVILLKSCVFITNLCSGYQLPGTKSEQTLLKKKKEVKLKELNISLQSTDCGHAFETNTVCTVGFYTGQTSLICLFLR